MNVIGKLTVHLLRKETASELKRHFIPHVRNLPDQAVWVKLGKFDADSVDGWRIDRKIYVEDEPLFGKPEVSDDD